MIARELTEFFASFSNGDVRVDSAPDPADTCDRFLLERELLRAARMLGGGALPRRRRTPRTRRSHGTRWRRGGEGLRARRGRAARTRLSVRAVHAPILRRVPRPARHDRPRRATGHPRAGRQDALAGERRRHVHAGRRMAATPPGALVGALRRATTPAGPSSRHSALVRRDCPARLQNALSLERARGRQPPGRSHGPSHARRAPILATSASTPRPALSALASPTPAECGPPPSPGLDHPALPARQRRAHGVVPAGVRARATWPLMLDLDPRPGRI